MKITKKWLEKNGACQSNIDWFLNKPETDCAKNMSLILNNIIFFVTLALLALAWALITGGILTVAELW